MSECVETLNNWGENFWGFAGPMLWQSSLLIAVVFAFDWVFARRIRASIRYALWMVALVKLLLPPALALPTGATWWLWRPHPAVEPPLIKNYTVSFDNTLPEFSPPTVPIVLPPPRLSTDAWVLLATTLTAVVFLSYLTFRWLRVAGKVRRAATAPAELNSLLDEARQLAGLRRRPRLKLIDDAQSPAVYGLFRPVILLPRTLANRLSVRQLRAVLLHETVHLQRGDVWVNCAQTLLQIAYWWHPLLWLANARIRRVREEAVDDAVMLALHDGADAYAPTLLEVAKYAFRRPLASLGLVGILESRSALRHRVERLMDFRPPRKAGVTFLSLCGICAFSAVALPMGEGPAATPGSDSDSIQRTSASNDKNVLIEGDFFWMTDDDFNSVVAGATYQDGRNGAAPIWTADPIQLRGVKARIKALGLQAFGRPRIETIPGRACGLYIGNLTNWIRLNCEPDVDDTNVVLDFKAESGSVSIQNGLETTNLQEISSKPTVDDDGGIVVRAPNPNGSASNLVVLLNVKTVSPEQGIVINQNTPTEVFRVNPIPEKDLRKLLEQAGVKTPPTICIYFKDGRVLARGTADQLADIQRVIGKLNGNSPNKLRTNLKKHVTARPGYIHFTDPDPARQALLDNLNNIRMDVSYENEPLDEVLRDLGKQSGNGINFIFNGDVRKINPATGFPFQSVDWSRINIKLNLKDATVQDVLNAICTGSDHPIEYSVKDYGVVFSPKDTNTVQYEMRTFKVDPRTFYAGLAENVATDDPTYDARHISALATAFFSKLGVNLDAPKTVFFNDRLGVLFVYATPQDLDVVEKAVQVLNEHPPMIHIKARFIEVPQTFLSSAVGKSFFSELTNGSILPGPEFQVFLHAVKSYEGSEELAEPEVTTISGRQTQMRATRLQEVVTNYIAKPNPDDPAGLTISPQTAQIETGPILDVFPTAFADGQSISLNAMADIIQFFGYASPQGLPISYATNSAGQKVPLPTSLPVFQVCEAQGVNTVFYDGQTLVLFPKPARSLIFNPDKKQQELITRFVQQAEKDDKAEYGNKVLLVLVTTTLIDQAGNRIHSDDEVPLAQAGAPPQSP